MAQISDGWLHVHFTLNSPVGKPISWFHQEKCDTVPLSAKPAAVSTIVPTPSSIQMPVFSSRDQMGNESPILTGVPSMLVRLKLGTVTVAILPGASCNRSVPRYSANSAVP